MKTPTEMKKIVVTQPVHPEVLARLQTHGRVVMNPGPEPWGQELLHQHLADADALMAFMPDRVDAHTLRHAPRLRTVACALKGQDNFDLVACARAGVQVSFVPDLLTAPTAELALGLAIAAARHVLEGDRRVRELGYHGWRPTLYGSGLNGATVAVVGLGAVGRAIVPADTELLMQEARGVGIKVDERPEQHVDVLETLFQTVLDDAHLAAQGVFQHRRG